MTLNPQPLTLDAPVWLLAAVPTHVRTWPRGSRFDRSVWFVDETDGEPIELVNLVDSTGWVRISLCPAELVSREPQELEQCRAENSAQSVVNDSDSSSDASNTTGPVSTVPRNSDGRSLAGAIDAGGEFSGGRDISTTGNASASHASEHNASDQPQRTTRSSTTRSSAASAVVPSLAPCECGFFTSSGTQCKGCGARLQGSDATDEAPAGLVTHGAAKAGRTRSTSRESEKPVETKLEPHLTRPDIDDVNAELASMARVSSPAPAAPVRDINAELQELRPAAEACPFEPTGEIPRATYSPVLLTPNEDRDELLSDGSRLIVRAGWMRPHVELVPPACYYDPAKLQVYNATRLAEVRDRLAACGWKFEEPEFTTEARRHGEDANRQGPIADNDHQPDQSTTVIVGRAVSNSSDVADSVGPPVPLCLRCEPSDSNLSPLTSRLSNEADHIASPGPAGAADSTPEEDPRRVRRQCEPGEYPDPSSDWDRNQRIGFRYVKGSGMRFGADSIEDLDRWRTWLGRVREFFEQVSVAASGREPSPQDACREIHLGV